MNSRPVNLFINAALIALIVVAAAVFVYRGPYRAMTIGNADFALVYSSARTWLVGGNPYDSQQISRVWLEAGGGVDRNPAERGSTVLLYPPATFALLSPLAALPWRLAAASWVALNVVLWLASVWIVGGMAGLRPGARTTRLYWAAGLAFAPAHTCIGHGQTAILAVALAVLGLAHLQRNGANPRGILPGVLLGLGAAIKPQVAALFTVYAGGRARWRAVAGSIAAVALALGIGAARMQLSGIPWWSSWRANVAAFTLTDDGDPTAANPWRFQLINLHFPLHTITDDRLVVRVSALVIVGALALAYYLVDRRRATRRADLCSLGVVSVVTLLVVYHRAYDACVLVLPLAWAIATLADPSEPRRVRRLAAAALVCVAAFLTPGGPMLVVLHEWGWVPDRLAASALWQTLLVPYATWALVLLGVMLILARASTPRDERPLL
ncbi:MAG: DUF2029 domain-containing protein [Phycisphaeraceae bacterium]|nr:DUF2029 domain-containing protein [Phycisphaeraceae bacterium]